MSDFRWDLRHWKTVEEFEAHLNQYSPDIVPWVSGLVLHHTFRPDTQSWRGATTMSGMKNYYQKLGWDSGPHLFVCVGSPNPENDGIWQMTALNEQGIHATTANRWAWGLEVVGYFDYTPWTSAQREMVYGVIETLFRWKGIDASRETLIGHREVPSPKTCPGLQVNMDTVRSDIASRLGD